MMKWQPAQRDGPGSTSYPWERVARRARWCGWCSTHGSAGGFESVARSAVGRRLRAWFAWHRRAAGDDRPAEGDGSRSAGRWQMAELQSCYTWSFPPVPMWAARAPAFSLLRIHETELVSTAAFCFDNAWPPWLTRTTGPGF